MQSTRKARCLSATPAGLVAIIIAAKASGDGSLQADAEMELNRRYDVRLRFGDSFPAKFNELVSEVKS